MRIAEFIWVIAIGLGINAIFIIAPFEVALNAMITSLAILALVWIQIARTSLSPASSLRRFSIYLFICLVFMFLYSLWNLVSKIFVLQNYWSYAWLALAFLSLIVASYKLMKIGTEFGFSAQAKGIKKILKTKAKKN